MRFLTTLILAVVLIAVVALIHYFGESPKEAVESETPLVPGLSAGDVTFLELGMYMNRKAVLERTKGGSWHLVEPFKDRARDEIVQQVLEGLVQNTRVTVPLSEAERDLPAKGLEPAEHHITFRDSRGTHTLYIGTRDPFRSETYVMFEGDDHLYRTGANLRNTLELNPSNLRDDRLFRIDPFLVNELSIMGPEGMIIQSRKQTGYWEITGPIRVDSESGNIQNAIARLTTLRERSRLHEGPIEDSVLEEGGFNGPCYRIVLKGGPFLKVVIVSSTGLGPNGDYLCIRQGEEGVVGINRTDLGWVLTKSLTFYRSKELLNPVRDHLKRLRIFRGETLALELKRLKDDRSYLITAPFEVPADNLSDGNTTPVFHFLTQVDGIRIQEFVADEVVNLAAFGLDRPVLKVELLYETGGSTKKALLHFGNDDGSGLVPAARADGPGPYSVCMVSAEDLAPLYKEAILLRDRRLFPPHTDFVADVQKATFTHNGTSITIERDEGGFFAKDPNSRFQQFLHEIKRETMVRFLAGFELYDSPYFLQLQGSIELEFKDSGEPVRIDFGSSCNEGWYGRISSQPEGIFIATREFIHQFHGLFEEL